MSIKYCFLDNMQPYWEVWSILVPDLLALGEIHFVSECTFRVFIRPHPMRTALVSGILCAKAKVSSCSPCL